MGWLSKILGTDKAKAAADDQRRLVAEQREAENARRARIDDGKRKIDQNFNRFDDMFYLDLKTAHQDNAKPQLDEQMGRANTDLKYHLARNGMLNSSVFNAGQADLKTQFSRGMQDISAQGADLVSKQKGQVEDYRTDLLRTLEATADSNLIAQQSVTKAAMLAQPSEFSPIAEMIKSGSAALGNQLALEKSAMDYGAEAPRYWTGAFGPKAGSTVTRN